MTLRCFVGIELAETLRDVVTEVIDILRNAGADVKWVEPHNLHLTLKFLGEIDEGAVRRAEAGVERAVRDNPAFGVCLEGVGAFPGSGLPRVVWIGVSSGAGELRSLAGAVERELAVEGFGREKRPFSPHLTIGRLRSPRGAAALSAATRSLSRRAVGCMDVSSVALVKSTLKPSGPVYERLRGWDLPRRLGNSVYS